MGAAVQPGAVDLFGATRQAGESLDGLCCRDAGRIWTQRLDLCQKLAQRPVAQSLTGAVEEVLHLRKTASGVDAGLQGHFQAIHQFDEARLRALALLVNSPHIDIALPVRQPAKHLPNGPSFKFVLLLGWHAVLRREIAGVDLSQIVNQRHEQHLLAIQLRRYSIQQQHCQDRHAEAVFGHAFAQAFGDAALQPPLPVELF